MKESTAFRLPQRVTDLIELKKNGIEVICQLMFEIVPVDFSHRDNPFRAYIFLCRYEGEVDGKRFSFRKCYARGCPHNLCPHVSQAVMIANRYLQRDYHRLEQAGIAIDKRLFTLEEMTVKFDKCQEERGPVRVIHDYTKIAEEGHPVTVDIEPEFVTAVEHFANHSNAQVFLMVNFRVSCEGKSTLYERCLSCYPANIEAEKPKAIAVANNRLKILYDDFDRVGIKYKRAFFQ